MSLAQLTGSSLSLSMPQSSNSIHPLASNATFPSFALTSYQSLPTASLQPTLPSGWFYYITQMPISVSLLPLGHLHSRSTFFCQLSGPPSLPLRFSLKIGLSFATLLQVFLSWQPSSSLTCPPTQQLKFSNIISSLDLVSSLCYYTDQKVSHSSPSLHLCPCQFQFSPLLLSSGCCPLGIFLDDFSSIGLTCPHNICWKQRRSRLSAFSFNSASILGALRTHYGPTTISDLPPQKFQPKTDIWHAGFQVTL